MNRRRLLQAFAAATFAAAVEVTGVMPSAPKAYKASLNFTETMIALWEENYGARIADQLVPLAV